jgi:signal peptidase I
VQITPGRVVAGAALVAAAALAGLRPGRVVVVGESMVPALQPGDRLLTLRLPAPEGTVVAVGDPRHPSRTLLKRLAAVPGGRALLPGGRCVDAGSGYVVLGDNPAASTDSVDFGPVPARLLRGRAIYRYAPAERRGALPVSPVARRAGGGDGQRSPDGNIQATPVTRPADHHEE